MKVYIKEQRYAFYYPEDMEQILGYLAKHGTIHASGEAIEKLYHDFSQDEYGVGWEPPTSYVLSAFADWISIIDAE